MRYWYFAILSVVFVLLFCNIYANQTDIKVDIVDNVPYIDYTISFDSNFSISLPDFSDLIYVKTLPSDIKYEIKDSKLNILDNKSGTIVLKYQGTEFLSGIKSYEKTLAFDLIGKTNITLISDANIVQLSPEPIIDNEYYNWNTNEKNFILYIVLYKNPFSWRVIIIIIVCFAIILGLTLPKYIISKRKKNKGQKDIHNTKENEDKDDEKENLFLDDQQKSILDLVKKSKAITQQAIADTLNIKKSHMSKILNKMERNNLIERKRVGKVNKIILAEKK